MHIIRCNIKCFALSLADLEMAIAYWNLVLSGRFKFLDLWNKFLLVSTDFIPSHLSPRSSDFYDAVLTIERQDL